MKMEGENSGATIADIRRFEQAHNVVLPPAYVNFLLEYNGGFPEAQYYVGDHGIDFAVCRFFSISPGNDEIEFSAEVTSLPIEEGWLPIGIGLGGDYLILSLVNGAVYCWEHEVDEFGNDKPLVFLESDVWGLVRGIERNEE